VKKRLLFGLVVLTLVTLPVLTACPATTPTPPTPPSKAIDPIVSTQWLEANIDTPDLVILDVREPDYYTAGHIPGSVNVPAFPNWWVNFLGEEWPWMEVPEQGTLFTTIGNAGITGDSLVVVVYRTADPMAGYAIGAAARVALTLMYAGVENVAMLDGGYEKWAADGKTISTEAFTPTAVTYSGVLDETMFASKDYVEEKMGEAILVEAREADIYYGIEQEFWTDRAGHIPTAKNLPGPWFWTLALDEAGVATSATWKDTSAAREMAFAVLGEDASQEIIVYCGLGGYASPVYFVLTQVIGYTNVKLYDGSMQEWTADPDAPVNKYRYE
jgi:thiosulfate/3-mercaptopyruvate sulfurtransferase